MNKNGVSIKGITHAAIIAALYVVLTYAAAFLGLSSGVIQFRISEMLNAFALFTPYAVPGLFVGCIAANILTGCIAVDVVVGSLATLVGAFFAYKFRKYPFVALLFPVIANAVAIPPVLAYAYGFEGSIIYFFFTVALGEIVCAYLLGLFLNAVVSKYKAHIFN
ncbi:MAG: QueT transporter family protein [Clostridia bacterium]|nr:QueT transporter family protein [Clostridia bacterium]